MIDENLEEENYSSDSELYSSDDEIIQNNREENFHMEKDKITKCNEQEIEKSSKTKVNAKTTTI